jgi:diaminohydroxyphosphoribosylaminopyrimidine deaminase/5-amino-6-(5-phosphoribosylamino)uracil reductase
MAIALAEARRGLGTTRPNPCVGAVVARDGVVLGVGHTEPPGGPHAEVVALRAAAAAGHDVAGATMYVTLEPCCHHGRTPPCTDAILRAGIRRVVVGVVDPYPPMQGRSLRLLQDAGVEVELGVGRDAADALMRGFLRVTAGGLPDVTLKAGVSLDGRIATAAGESRWITGEAAREHAHTERAAHDAILVGIHTALADDPALDVRLPAPRASSPHPVPVVLDARLRLPPTARLLNGRHRAIVITAEDAPAVELPAEVVRVPRGPGGVDAEAALRALGARGLHRVLVEGGGAVHRTLLDARLADRLLLYVAPLVLPGGRGWVGGAPATSLGDAARFGSPRTLALGDDVLLEYALPHRDARPNVGEG